MLLSLETRILNSECGELSAPQRSLAVNGLMKLNRQTQIFATEASPPSESWNRRGGAAASRRSDPISPPHAWQIGLREPPGGVAVHPLDDASAPAGCSSWRSRLAPSSCAASPTNCEGVRRVQQQPYSHQSPPRCGMSSKRLTSSASARGGSSPAKAISLGRKPGMTTRRPFIIPWKPAWATASADI